MNILNLKTRHGGEVFAWAVVELTTELMDRIITLNKAVLDAGAYTIEEFNYHPDWTVYEEDDEGNEIPGEPLRTECDQLVVGNDEFWWKCYLKHTDIVLHTERTSIKESKR